jgi:DNA-binding beta-propeller fold protein YncE
MFRHVLDRRAAGAAGPGFMGGAAVMVRGALLRRVTRMPNHSSGHRVIDSHPAAARRRSPRLPRPPDRWPGSTRRAVGIATAVWGLLALLLAASVLAGSVGARSFGPLPGASPFAAGHSPSSSIALNTSSGNDSPAVEAALPRGTVSVGFSPVAVAYDPQNGYTYVANNGSNTLTILSGTNERASFVVGVKPEGLLVLPNGTVFVSCVGDAAIAVVVNTTLVTTLSNTSWFDGPLGMAYDPLNGEIYVANNYALAGTVAVLSAHWTLVTMVSVGGYPRNVAFDPSDGYIYVTDAANATDNGESVSVIGGTSVVSTISGGPFNTPAGIAYDPADGDLYVANAYVKSGTGGGSVTILNGTTIVGTTVVGGSAIDAAYDPLNHWMYVIERYSDNVSVFDGTTFLGSFSVGSGGQSLGFGAFAAGSPGLSTLMVPQWTADQVAYFATGGTLSLGPSTAWIGNNSTVVGEVGVPMTFNTSLLSPGIGLDSEQVSSTPAAVLGCPLSPQATIVPHAAELKATCTPTAPGQFVFSEQVTDADGVSVSSWMAVTIVHALRPLVLTAVSSSGALPKGSLPFDASMAFAGTTSEGAGNYTYHWVYGGVASGACASEGPFAACSFTTSGPGSVNLTVSDALGATVENGTTFVVAANATAPAPIASSSGGGASGFVLLDLLLGLVIGVLAGVGVGAAVMRRRARAPPAAYEAPPPEA